MNLVSAKVVQDGSGNGSATIKAVHGIVAAIFVDKQSQNANPDVTVSDAFGRDLLAVTGVTANTLYPVAVQATDSTGAGIADTYKSPPIASDITITVASGDASGTLLVYVYYQ